MNTLDWTFENMITVTLMVLLSFFIAAGVFKAVSAIRNRGAAQAAA